MASSSLFEALQGYDPRKTFPEDEQEFLDLRSTASRNVGEALEMIGSTPPGRTAMGIPPVAAALKPAFLKQLRQVMSASKRDPGVIANFIKLTKTMPRKFQRGISEITSKEEALQRSIAQGAITPRAATTDYAASRGVFEPGTRTLGIDPQLFSQTTGLHEGGHGWRNRLIDMLQDPSRPPLNPAEEQARSVYEVLDQWYHAHPEDIERLSGITDVSLSNPNELLAQLMGELLATNKYKREFSLFPDELQHLAKKLRRYAR